MGLKIKGVVFLFLFSSIFYHTFCQVNIPLGTWRSHYPFYQVSSTAAGGEKIYGGTGNGIVVFDKSDNSLAKLGKLDGLQENNVSALGYAEGALFIGYASGNMDIILGNTIESFDFTTNSQITGDKTINGFTFFQNYAYISTAYGVLKFDTRRRVVQETYREIGLDGPGQPGELQVYNGVIYNDSIFLATEQGVLAANVVENYNLLDYTNWKRFGSADGIPETNISALTVFNGKVLATVSGNDLYEYENGNWTATGLFIDRPLGVAKATENDLYVIVEGDVVRLDRDFNVVSTIHEYEALTLTTDAEGKLWAGTSASGIVSGYTGTLESFVISGPLFDQAFRFQYINGHIVAMAGGFDRGDEPEDLPGMLSIFSEGQWRNYSSTLNNLSEINDLVDAAYAPAFTSTFYASAGNGLLQVTDEGGQLSINASNSPLVNVTNNDSSIYVTAIEGSAQGLWVLNYNSGLIHLLNNSGGWETFTIPISAARYAIDILVTGNLLWLRIDPQRGGGIVVYDPGQNVARYLNTTNGEGGLPDNVVNTMALDRDGFVWVGTNEGVSVFLNPFSVLSGSVDGVEPIFENRQLLVEEEVTAIEIDGGNRKWMGTNNGVWLFDAEAGQQVHYFNTANSPLPGDEVLDIEIHDETGEVFIGTNEGIISYRAPATVSTGANSNVQIYPNPVTPDFNGRVGISGLVTDADVRITDISGKLIWQTRANGGTASWNVRDYNGSRAATGVYLVFISSDGGEDALVGKIAVVN